MQYSILLLWAMMFARASALGAAGAEELIVFWIAYTMVGDVFQAEHQYIGGGCMGSLAKNRCNFNEFVHFITGRSPVPDIVPEGTEFNFNIEGQVRYVRWKIMKLKLAEAPFITDRILNGKKKYKLPQDKDKQYLACLEEVQSAMEFAQKRAARDNIDITRYTIAIQGRIDAIIEYRRADMSQWAGKHLRQVTGTAWATASHTVLGRTFQVPDVARTLKENPALAAQWDDRRIENEIKEFYHGKRVNLDRSSKAIKITRQHTQVIDALRVIQKLLPGPL
jgi:hypothetical protein